MAPLTVIQAGAYDDEDEIDDGLDRDAAGPTDDHRRNRSADPHPDRVSGGRRA